MILKIRPKPCSLVNPIFTFTFSGMMLSFAELNYGFVALLAELAVKSPVEFILSSAVTGVSQPDELYSNHLVWLWSVKSGY